MRMIFLRTDFYGAVTEGGVASLHMGQIKAFLKDGHSCAYASCGRLKLPEGVNYYFLPYSKFFRNFPEVYTLPHSKRAARMALDVIEKEKPDFFLQHHSDFNYAGSIVKKKTGLPFVLHCDGVEIWVKKNWGRLYFSHLLKWAEEIQWSNADVINVPSAVVKRMMIEHGVKEEKILVNPNGVDPDFFSPEVDGQSVRQQLGLKDEFVVGFVGTFGHWHGVDVLAESVKHLKKMIPNVKVLFVGDGLLRPKIEEIIKNDGVGDNCILTGIVPYEQVPAYMAACDTLATPCVTNEDQSEFFNSPIKLFEYMSMAKPVVATGVGQQGEIIKDGTNGYICAERSPEDLAETIYRVFSDRESSKASAIKAREDVVTNYDWRMYNQRIIDRVERLI